MNNGKKRECSLWTNRFVSNKPCSSVGLSLVKMVREEKMRPVRFNADSKWNVVYWCVKVSSHDMCAYWADTDRKSVPCCSSPESTSIKLSLHSLNLLNIFYLCLEPLGMTSLTLAVNSCLTRWAPLHEQIKSAFVFLIIYSDIHLQSISVIHTIKLKNKAKFTFMHLTDAFIQSDLHCIQVTVLHFISSCFP